MMEPHKESQALHLNFGCEEFLFVRDASELSLAMKSPVRLTFEFQVCLFWSKQISYCPPVLQDATPKSQGAVAPMQEMPVEQKDGGLQKVANGKALLCCTCHVFQSSMKFFANMTSLNFWSVWQGSGVMEPHEDSQALRPNFEYEEFLVVRDASELS